MKIKRRVRKVLYAGLFLFIFSASGCNIIKEGESKMTDAKITESVKRIEEFPSQGIITPGMSSEMLSYEFWTSKLSEGNKIIMDITAINSYNEQTIKKVDAVYSLERYKESLNRNELSEFIKEYRFTEKMKFDDKGVALKKEFLDSIMKNTNLDSITDDNKIRYGVSIKKLSVRTFPTEVGAYDNAYSTELDRFQETACPPCEAVLILHESSDRKWFFIQMYNYRGWVKTEGIALSKDKKTVFDYINSENFLMVTGNHISLEEPLNSEANKVFMMGNKLPLAANQEKVKDGKSYHVVKLPVRTKEGYLKFTEGFIARTKDAIEGYLPYTRENIIKQAFKLQGEKYDWGNKFSGRDCSSFIADIYKTFGFLLPRNAGEQESGYGKLYKFSSGDSIEKRNKLMDEVKPGAAIFLPGHVTMYIGKHNGVHYMIHDFLAYGKKEDNKYVSVPVSAVAVTSTLLTVTSGTPYIQRFNSIVQFEH